MKHVSRRSLLAVTTLAFATTAALSNRAAALSTKFSVPVTPSADDETSYVKVETRTVTWEDNREVILVCTCPVCQARRTEGLEDDLAVP